MKAPIQIRQKNNIMAEGNWGPMLRYVVLYIPLKNLDIRAVMIPEIWKFLILELQLPSEARIGPRKCFTCPRNGSPPSERRVK